MRKVVVFLALLGIAVAVFASLNLQPNLKRMDVAILSGAEGGSYHAVVARLAEAARPERGRVTNVATRGSADNIARLAAARQSCDVQFALVQDGLDWPEGLEFVARLPRAESVFLLGRNVGRIRGLADLDGLRIGIGPEGSGTSRLARTILNSPFLEGLHLTLTHHPLDEQLTLVERGDLDLALIVMDEDTPLIVHAVRDRRLDILDLPQADVIARRLPRVRTGRIGAGQYDPLRLMPATDRTVLRVETLLIGNGCARPSATAGLLTLLAREFPDFVRRNRDTPNATGLSMPAAARSFFDGDGPDLASRHLPWAVDIMPLSNWIYALTAVSVLFNLTAAWSRFRLWRLDARRSAIEDRLDRLFHAGITPAELADLAPDESQQTAAHRAETASLIEALERLRATCRAQAAGWVADMGEELPYRYQEKLASELMRALRSFQARVLSVPPPSVDS